MPVKLLSPQQVKDAKSSDLARELLRAGEINEAVDKARKSLANAEADFAQMIAGQRARWAREEKEHADMVEKNGTEIRELEARRSRALEPVNELHSRAEAKMKEAQDIYDFAVKKVSDNERLAEILQDKLDMVGQREQDVVRAEQAITVSKQNIEMEQDLILRRNATLIQVKDDFEANKTARTADMRERENALILKERTLQAKAVRLENTEKELIAFKTKLDDERGVLDREIIRIEKEKKKA